MKRPWEALSRGHRHGGPSLSLWSDMGPSKHSNSGVLWSRLNLGMELVSCGGFFFQFCAKTSDVKQSNNLDKFWAWSSGEIELMYVYQHRDIGCTNSWRCICPIPCPRLGVADAVEMAGLKEGEGRGNARTVEDSVPGEAGEWAP